MGSPPKFNKERDILETAAAGAETGGEGAGEGGPKPREQASAGRRQAAWQAQRASCPIGALASGRGTHGQQGLWRRGPAPSRRLLPTGPRRPRQADGLSWDGHRLGVAPSWGPVSALARHALFALALDEVPFLDGIDQLTAAFGLPAELLTFPPDPEAKDYPTSVEILCQVLPFDPLRADVRDERKVTREDFEWAVDVIRGVLGFPYSWQGSTTLLGVRCPSSTAPSQPSLPPASTPVAPLLQAAA